VILLLVVFAGGSWYVSGMIESGALASTPAAPIPGFDDVEVVAVTDNGLTLKKGPDAGENFDAAAKFALAWEGGYGQVGPATVNPDGSVTRSLDVIEGTAPTVGQQAGIDRSYWLSDFATDLGEPKLDVTIGEFPAWYFPNGATDPVEIAIFVHGQNGIRENGLRFVDAVRDLNLPVLVITYRNDLGAPPDPSGRLGYGATEWPDLDAAVAWALDKGANDVVLVGQSMGAGIVAAFLENSERADAVSKVVLDAPMLSLPMSVDYGARNALPGGLGVPAPILWGAKQVASWRFGVDWAAIDYLDDTSWLKVPALVMHGEADPRVPVTVSETFARLEPDLVLLHQFTDALHTEAWNFDSARWNQEVVDFLSK
jgi:dienelactone hydrolase